MSEYLQQFIQNITIWLLAHGIKILVIFFAVYLVKKVSGKFVERVIRKMVLSDRFLSKEAEKKREDTLIHISNSALGVLIWVVAGLMILQDIGLQVGPLLAAAGVAGLVFGFGGQYLIRDLISGFFIIFENQYRVEDITCFDGTCGFGGGH